MKKIIIIVLLLIDCGLNQAQTSNSFIQAMAFKQQEQYSEAVLLFNKAIEETSTSEKIYLNRGICFYYLHETEKAEADLLNAQSLGKNEALIYLAGLQSQAGNFESAISYLQKLLDSNPSVSITDLSINPILLKLTASTAWKDFVLDFHPGPVSESIISVEYLLNNGKINEAGIEVKKALKKYPQSTHLAILAAKVYARQLNYPLAQFEISKALLIEPINSELLFYFSTYAELNGNLSQSIEKLTEVKNNEPENFEVYLRLANAYLNLGKPEEAKKETGFYLTYFPTEQEANYLDALASFGTANFTACLKTMNRLMNDSQNISPEWFKLRGMTYFEASVYQNSASDLSMCLDLTPNDAEANYYLGLAQLKLENKSAACFYLNRAFKFGDKRAFNLIAENCE